MYKINKAIKQVSFYFATVKLAISARSKSHKKLVLRMIKCVFHITVLIASSSSFFVKNTFYHYILKTSFFFIYGTGWSPSSLEKIKNFLKIIYILAIMQPPSRNFLKGSIPHPSSNPSSKTTLKNCSKIVTAHQAKQTCIYK